MSVKDVNRFFATGNLGRDCEIRYASNGTAFTSFSIACNRGYKDKEGVEHKNVQWLNCVIIGARGPAVQKFLKKGARVLIDAEYRERQWEDKSGAKKKSSEFIIDQGGDIQILKFPENSGQDHGNDSSKELVGETYKDGLRQNPPSDQQDLPF
jgi:single-strand DNA-binding protein